MHNEAKTKNIFLIIEVFYHWGVALGKNSRPIYRIPYNCDPVNLLHLSFDCREDFVYEKGVKNGPAILYGVSGATRKGQLRNGKWHGEATYTAQVQEQTE